MAELCVSVCVCVCVCGEGGTPLVWLVTYSGQPAHCLDQDYVDELKMFFSFFFMVLSSRQ